MIATFTVIASIGSNVRDVVDAVRSFVMQFAQLDPKWLAVSLILFQAYLLLRSRALFNALRMAYPKDDFQWRRVWGASVTGYGMNNVLPAGTGNLFQYVFTRDAIASATYPVVVVAITSAAVFDGALSLLVLGLCFTTTRAFPHLAHIAGLSSFDIGLYLTRTVVLVVVLAALIASVLLATVYRDQASRAWQAIRRGTRILRSRRYLSGMVPWQSASWVARAASYWFMLRAFGITPTPGRVLDVLGINVLASVVPFTPSGIGIQQALIVAVFAKAGSADHVVAFSVGQQLAFGISTLVVALIALWRLFGIRGFRRAIREARQRRQFDRDPAPADGPERGVARTADGRGAPPSGADGRQGEAATASHVAQVSGSAPRSWS